MTASVTATKSSAQSDAAFADLVEELTARVHQGERLELNALVREHPEHAERLAQLLPALRLLADISGLQPARLLAEGAKEKHDPLIGTLGDFRILREIGRGGMGVVYEAEQISLGRHVALKVLPFASTLDPKQLQRFKNEAQAAAGLHHTNIVPVHATGCERGVHYYAMQFIEGQTLAHVIADLYKPEAQARVAAEPGQASASKASDLESPPTELFRPQAASESGSKAAETPPQARLSTLPSTRGRGFFQAVARLGIQAAEALDYSHELGVIHRDIKPGNLLVDSRGKLWITDFGLAHCQSQAGLTMSGDLVGTLRYMSPEQALAKRVLVDHRTDIYSLGATLYELIAGEPVFGGADRQELLRQIAFEEPKPLRRHNKSIPAELEIIVLKALEKNPADRYATAKEMAEDLERFVKDEPIRARRPSLARRVRGWCRRRKVLVTALGVLLFTVLALGGITLWQQERQRAATAQAVEDDWKEAELWWQQEQWAKALPALERASGRLAGSGLASLQAKVDQRRRDAAMLTRLEKARLQLISIGWRQDRDYAAGDRAYGPAFAEFGIEVDRPDVEEVARRIRSSAIRSHLVRALDNWAFCKDHLPGDHSKRLLDLAELADDDLWRRDVRRIRQGKDQKALEHLAKSEAVLAQPPENVLILFDLLHQAGADATGIEMLKKVQVLHPADFWVNYQLGFSLGDDPKTAGQAVGYCRAALAAQPQSPVVCLNLANALGHHNMLNPKLPTGGWPNEPEAEALTRKAIALQPDYAVAYVHLGNGLNEQRRFSEADAAFRKAIELKPDCPFYIEYSLFLFKQGKLPEAEAAFRKCLDLKGPDDDKGWNYLGVILLRRRNWPGAEAAFRKSIRLKPENPTAYRFLGAALRCQGRRTEAEVAVRKAIRFEPDNTHTLHELAINLLNRGKLIEREQVLRKAFELEVKGRKTATRIAKGPLPDGRLEQVWADWRRELDENPPEHEKWYGYAELCLFLGKEPEYRRARSALLDRFDTSTDPNVAERTGRACLLLPAGGDELRNAVALIDCALAVGKKHKDYPYFLFAKGLAEYRLGDFDNATSVLRGEASKVLGPLPGLVLAMAQHRSGLKDSARKTLAAAILACNWSKEYTTDSGAWIPHVLRREAETLIIPNIQAYVQGKQRPQDNDERIALLGICEFEGRNRSLSTLYAEAFAAKPKLMANVRIATRFKAAKAAALAGCGQGIDAAGLDAHEYARLRAQACAWLRADLVLWHSVFDKQPDAHVEVQEKMQDWQEDDAFAGVRGVGLAKLPEAERQEWQKLWQDVEELKRRAGERK